MDKSGKKVTINVPLVMEKNFVSDNFALRSLIGPQLANWIIGQNFGNRVFVRYTGNDRARSETRRKYRFRP